MLSREKSSSLKEVSIPADDFDRDSQRYEPPRQYTVHRTLKARHVQLIGIGGSIGTALFVQIGFVLPHGGPASLLIAFIFWCSVIFSVNNCLAEMVTWMPVSSPFVRFCDRFVDPAFGFCAGINFFVYLAFLVPFEVTAFSVILQFWTDKIPTAAIVTFVLISYALFNVFAARIYGETEFWLAIGKIFLALGLLFFTFITMVGGNPLKDPFGFRHWNPAQVPGTPFVEYFYGGSTGRFMGFMSCLIQATFTICGPEYLSMAAGEAQNPRKVIPRTYRSIGFRLAIFFIGGALSVGILLRHDDPNLAVALSDPKPGAGSSPYVIAMQNLKIPGLPHLVNVLILLSVYSAGNSYVFCASRTLYGLALEGKMPRVLTKCSKSGVPIYCVGVTMAISLLSYLQVSNNSAKVIDWFVALVTACQVCNYTFICVAYIKFYHALKAQGIDRNTLPYKGPLQPFCGYYSLFFTFIMMFMVGYTVFLPGNWDATSFIFSYLVLMLLPFLFIAWKTMFRTKFVKLRDVDFFTQERKEIDEYEDSLVHEPPTSRFGRFWEYILG